LVKTVFHYSLIDTSKRAFADDAISIRAILHAKNLRTRESCIQVLKRKGIVKILWTPCRTSAPLFALMEDPLKGSTIVYIEGAWERALRHRKVTLGFKEPII
jgi:hypothetical protein